MDVLRPQIIRIGDRCYRKNPTLNRDVNALEEEEYEEAVVQCDSWNDESCDIGLDIQETDGGFQTSMNLPSAFFKHIIGRKAETKRRLENETKTQIKIPREGVEGDIVITGPERNGVVSAKTRIDVIVDSVRRREPFTHFLSLPVTSPSVREKFLEFQEEVLRSCDGDRGIDATIFQKPEKLHLTIGTLALLNQREIQQAMDTLEECKTSLIEPILRGEDLRVRLQGLEYMNDDPSAVDVLYAKIQPGDQAERLQILADRLVDRFSTTGLMQQEYSRVKLHVTVMNTLMRRDPTSIPGERPPEGKRGNKERESFDAMNLMKKFGHYDFGDYTVDSLHLSQRHGLGKDGYYGCAGAVLLP
uniref:Activating signal cointegrator 1 complex subunit 1-like n=1 Tax=Crassostrea virginica TaxID=6565 RepID=A0A8B8F001_CRAVI|nr:activating signal cointegrator 1 complex subunit 1-like [Crassostrea virginica]XP_022345640.1 activating signal cointegrator 1 complex subunit 1-like [Crassostrea virginica]